MLIILECSNLFLDPLQYSKMTMHSQFLFSCITMSSTKIEGLCQALIFKFCSCVAHLKMQLG